ncbi:hypothetical protein [Actinacidiphila rubida]|uniref:RiboL-PSP-HEPN domain-containing protein n=1 Tax=Actinacidiphila rubida TaxID=310780 RepID=A0A1H8TB80_9ACTN|nr:hypothetical protein [Actinacidiphila rubida]SEO88006.1 hypothetical protein SAMN05216267_105019 [Actinacidiphila rubida]
MTSRARDNFFKDCEHIDRLLEIRNKVTADEYGGLRQDADTLHNSASVLLTAFWGAFCQELAADALDRLIEHARGADELPAYIQRLADWEPPSQADGWVRGHPTDRDWCALLSARAVHIRRYSGAGLLARATTQVNELFKTAIGNDQISRSWYWPGMESAQAAARLDLLVKLRGRDHRNTAAGPIVSRRIDSDYRHVRKLVRRTEIAVEQTLANMTWGGEVH